MPPLAPAPVEPGERVRRVPLSHIQPCPFQPRKDFGPEALKELADSIREQGIVQPLVVRERNGHLELIAGERRWRAAQLAQLSEVPIAPRSSSLSSKIFSARTSTRLKKPRATPNYSSNFA